MGLRKPAGGALKQRWVPYREWTTSDGRVFTIENMETSHIENTRNMLARHMGGHEIIYRMHFATIGGVKPLVARFRRGDRGSDARMRAEVELQKTFRYILTFEQELERRRGLEER